MNPRHRLLRLGSTFALLVLSLALVGSRGLWLPDEGRNVNIALAMLDSGDFWQPRLAGNLYLDKPPLHYWTLAAGMAVLGENEWGARVPHALLFCATALLAGALAAKMWNARVGLLATWTYAVMLGPFAAGSVITPDTPLALFVVALFYGVWRASRAEAPRQGSAWWLFAGVAAGLAFLTKGPATLLFGPPIVVFLIVRRRLLSTLRLPWLWIATLLAVGLGAAWYVPICSTIPGAREYLFDNQVTGRLITARYNRNPGLEGALRIYFPALLLGTLPFSLMGLWSLRKRETWHRLRSPIDRLWPRTQRNNSPLSSRSPAAVLIAGWIALPTIVLVAASSHLPLYVLPLFAPIALASAHALAQATDAPAVEREGSGGRGQRGRLVALAGWALVLIALRATAAQLETHRDTRKVAHWLTAQNFPPFQTVLLADAPLEGLSLYGFKNLRSASLRSDPYPLFTPLKTLEQAARDLANQRRTAAVLVPDHKVNLALQALAAGGLNCRRGGVGLRLAAIFCEGEHPARQNP